MSESNEEWDRRLQQIRAEMVDEKRALPQGYLAALPFAIRAARERGYALAHHGTFGRDLDLVAVPWTDEAVAAEELVLAVAAATGSNVTRHDKNPTRKPHGRLAWSLHFFEHTTDGPPIPTGLYIDLSVMPRLHDPETNPPTSPKGTAP
jgi:hypothetical protein